MSFGAFEVLSERTLMGRSLLSSGKVDDLQPFLFSIVHCIGCPAAVLGQIADTHAAVVHQVAVSFEHTSSCVLPGGVDHFIRLGLDALILRYVLRPPAPCLRQAGQDKDQFYGGAVLPQAENRLGGEAVKLM